SLTLEVLVEPGDRFLLSLPAGFIVDAVVLDALDGDELLDAGSSLVGQDRVVLVVKQFFLLGDDEQFRAMLAAADVLGWSVADAFLNRWCAGQGAELLARLGVANLSMRPCGGLGERVVLECRTEYPAPVH